MAKSQRRTKRNLKPLYRRDAVAIARAVPREDNALPEVYLLRNLPYVNYTTSTPYQSKIIIDDNRSYNPDPTRPPLTISGNYSRVIAPTHRNIRSSRRNISGIKRTFPSYKLRLAYPEKTIVCLRRNRRKEVIHAKGIAGSRVAKPKFNINSQLHCR
ncbi:hypothetical protein [Apis mellifera associated microvirus 54]|nr:hypothetical protein [Apis mellifera associated microvirus 54]